MKSSKCKGAKLNLKKLEDKVCEEPAPAPMQWAHEQQWVAQAWELQIVHSGD